MNEGAYPSNSPASAFGLHNLPAETPVPEVSQVHSLCVAGPRFFASLRQESAFCAFWRRRPAVFWGPATLRSLTCNAAHHHLRRNMSPPATLQNQTTCGKVMCTVTSERKQERTPPLRFAHPLPDTIGLRKLHSMGTSISVRNVSRAEKR